jgi:chlorite dismutase
MLYAKKMLALLEQGKRIINIDETWLPHLDFRNMKWRVPGEHNTVSTKVLSHRVNMIAAIDTDGRLYLSLTQFNTDGDVMLMFMSRLANVLSEENKDWRDDTYWLLDNAAYHRSS